MKFTIFILALVAILVLAQAKPTEKRQKETKKGRATGPGASGAGAAQTPAGNGFMQGGQNPFMAGWQFSGFPNMARPNGMPSGFNGFWG